MSREAPLFAIVGRPNVGKSTLFNAITGKAISITSPIPGTTRDWMEAPLIKSTIDVRVADTCGFGMRGAMGSLMDASTEQLLTRSSAVLFVVNPGSPPSQEEMELASHIRKTGLPVITVCNKCDSEREDALMWVYLKMGLGSPLPVSAIAKRNLSELTSRIGAEAADITDGVKTAPEGRAEARCVLLGQPNVGKSTLFNAMVEENRSLVHDEPGTTRDPVRAVASVGGERWEMVDTAGVGRRWRGNEAIYREAQARSIKALNGSDVAVLVFDLTVPLVRQDLRLASEIEQRGLGLAVVLNKADLIDKETRNDAENKAAVYLHERFPGLGRFPVIIGSAKNGEGVSELREAVRELDRLRKKRIPAEVLAEISSPWPTSGRPWVVRQMGIEPLSFMANPPQGNRLSSRFVINQLRESFGLHGVPIEVRWRKVKK